MKASEKKTSSLCVDSALFVIRTMTRIMQEYPSLISRRADIQGAPGGEAEKAGRALKREQRGKGGPADKRASRIPILKASIEWEVAPPPDRFPLASTSRGNWGRIQFRGKENNVPPNKRLSLAVLFVFIFPNQPRIKLSTPPPVSLSFPLPLHSRIKQSLEHLVCPKGTPKT